MKVFTDKKTPLGANYAYQLQQTNRILAEARKVGVSITGGCGQMTAVHRVQGDCNLVTSNTEVQDEII